LSKTGGRLRSSDVIAGLLSRRIVFVTGKGGTGKTTITAALALLGAWAGKRVLCIDANVKGDLPRLLGSAAVGFKPREVQPGVSLLTLTPEESLQEYMAIYFKIPRFVRLTPLARLFDFVAAGVPGTRELLIIGKIAYEERRAESGRPAWDLIIVDGSATGGVVPQLSAARSIMDLSRGGMIQSQAEWVDKTLIDPRRTALTICALPQEMPVAEAIELHERVRAETRVTLGACFLNRTFPVAVTRPQTAVMAQLAAGDATAATARLGGEIVPIVEAARIAERLHRASVNYARILRARMNVPLVEIPLDADAQPGLSLARAVATALGGVTR